MDQPTNCRLGHSTNMVGLATDLLGSDTFNEDPREIHLSGVREMNGRLFEMLGQADDLADAGDAFYKYMVAMFGIDPEQHDAPASRTGGPRRYRSSFLRLLKGWVESRFGLFPTFHKERINRFAGQGWITYVEEKMSSRFHNNSIYCQLDILYEFCQWALARHVAAGQRHLTLYRGVNSFEEHQIVTRIDRKTVVMHLNNLASFTSDRSVADCFGDVILTVRVPVVKVLFFNTLLALHPLKGEGEFLVIGGDYRVRSDYV